MEPFGWYFIGILSAIFVMKDEIRLLKLQLKNSQEQCFKYAQSRIEFYIDGQIMLDLSVQEATDMVVRLVNTNLIGNESFFIPKVQLKFKPAKDK